MILTTKEINDISDHAKAHVGTVWPHFFAQLYEAAVLAKLAAWVSVKPAIETTAFSRDSSTQHYYSLEQIRTCIAAARVKAIEECAKLVEYRMDEQEPWLTGDEVRALKGTTP